MIYVSGRTREYVGCDTKSPDVKYAFYSGEKDGVYGAHGRGRERRGGRGRGREKEKEMPHPAVLPCGVVATN